MQSCPGVCCIASSLLPLACCSVPGRFAELQHAGCRAIQWHVPSILVPWPSHPNGFSGKWYMLQKHGKSSGESKVVFCQ